MNTLELIKDSCLFGGTIPNERTEEVRTFLDNLEKQLTIPVVVKSFYCLSDPKEGGLKRCEKQCKGCEMSKYNKQ